MFSASIQRQVGDPVQLQIHSLLKSHKEFDKNSVAENKLVKIAVPHRQVRPDVLAIFRTRGSTHPQLRAINQSINQSKHISIAPYVASESEAHPSSTKILS